MPKNLINPPKKPIKKKKTQMEKQHIDDKHIACYSMYLHHWSRACRDMARAILIMSLAGIYMLMTNMDISVHVYDVYSQPPFALWLLNLIIFTLTALAYLVFRYLEAYGVLHYILPSFDDKSYKLEIEQRFIKRVRYFFLYPYYSIFILGVVLLLVNKVIGTGFWP